MTDETRTLTREQQLAEEFKDGLDPAGAIALGQRLDELTLRVDAIEELLAL